MQIKPCTCPGDPGECLRRCHACCTVFPMVNQACYRSWPCAACRVYVANRKYILIAAALQALLAGWALLLTVTAGTQPLVASASSPASLSPPIIT